MRYTNLILGRVFISNLGFPILSNRVYSYVGTVGGSTEVKYLRREYLVTSLE